MCGGLDGARGHRAWAVDGGGGGEGGDCFQSQPEDSPQVRSPHPLHRRGASHDAGWHAGVL